MVEIREKVSLIKETVEERVSGVWLKMKNTDGAVLVPYRYNIKDKECQKTLRKGYLSVWEVQGEKDYFLKFRPVVAKEGQLCLELEPIKVNGQDYNKYLKMSLDYKWLYY